VHGCDSTVTLNLTLWESTTQALVESSCSPIEFGGNLITETGSYTESIQSIHGCDSITVLNFTLLESPQPSIQGETTTCIGGFLLLEGIDASGSFDGTPEWLLNGSSASMGQTYAVPTGTGGDLDVTVVMTNAAGCTETAEVTVTVGPEVMPEITSVDVFSPTCHGANDGIVQWNTNDPGGQLTFVWEPSVSTNSLGSDLSAGFYIVQISSTPNCVITSDVLLEQPEPIAFGEMAVIAPFCGESNGLIETEVSGGSGSLDLAWDNGAVGGTLDGIVEGAYTLTVTDDNGCRADTTIEVDCNGEPDIVPYQFISPNGDGLNDVWVIDHINYYPDAEVFVYNRWGSLVKTLFAPYQNDWPGTGEDDNTLSPDSYFFVIEPNNGGEAITGFLEIQYTE